MQNNNFHPLRILALASCLFVSPVVAAEVGDWDRDRDGRLSQSEFSTGFDQAGLFDRWDADYDNRLSSSELDEGLGENQDAFYNRFGDDVSDWDTDSDGYFSRNELYSGAYSGYGPNEDGYIEEPELGDVGDDIGDGGFWDV